MALAPVTAIDDELEQAGKPAGPCAMVVFGATGDLTMRKLVPALYNLGKAHLLPREFAVVGVAIDDMNLGISDKRLLDFCRRKTVAPTNEGTRSTIRYEPELSVLHGNGTEVFQRDRAAAWTVRAIERGERSLAESRY